MDLGRGGAFDVAQEVTAKDYTALYPIHTAPQNRAGPNRAMLREQSATSTEPYQK